MPCKNCGTKILPTDIYCPNCGKELAGSAVGASPEPTQYTTNPSFAKKPTSAARKIIGGIIGVVILFGIVGMLTNNPEKQKQEATNILKDSLNNTQTASPENEKYTKALKQLFEYFKKENDKLLSVDKKLANSTFLEFESFKTRQSINSYILDLKLYIQELDNYEKSLGNIRANAESIFASSGMTKQEVQEVIEGFNKSMNDPTQQTLRVQRTDSLRAYIQACLDLYEFLSTNFQYYSIEPDDYGEEQIYFELDKLVNEYNSLAGMVQTTVDNFLANDEALRKYVNNKLQNLGLGVTASDFEGYFAK